MILSGKAVLIGAEEKKSKQGNAYYVVAIAQGADVVKLFTSNADCLKWPVFKEYTVTFEYNTSNNRLVLENMRTV